MDGTLASERAGGMSRRSQTVWICGTLVALAAIGGTVWAAQPDPNDPFAECDSFLGGRDPKCAADIARRNIRSGVLREDLDRLEAESDALDAAMGEASGMTVEEPMDFERTEDAASLVGEAASWAAERIE